MEQVKPDLENPLSSPMADPKNALADAFIAINNPQERIANLTNLIQALSPWERRHVRMELGDHDDLAGFEDLPVDVVCGIIPYLKIEDVIACSAVSKRCRTSWTEPAVASATSLHFFPALQAPFDFSKFSEVCKKYFVRRAGRFALRVSTSLPFSSNDTLAGVLFSPTLQQWDLDSRRILRPDPVIHPEDEYPPGWLEMLNAKFACYGGGNVVWFGLPDFVVIDNMYKRERRVVNIQAWITPAWTAVSSKALVVVHNVSKNTLWVISRRLTSSACYRRY